MIFSIQLLLVCDGRECSPHICTQANCDPVNELCVVDNCTCNAKCMKNGKLQFLRKIRRLKNENRNWKSFAEGGALKGSR